MHKQFSLSVVAIVLAIGCLPVTNAAAGTEQKSIHALLTMYEQVLNASDVDGVLSLYSDDGVFMAQHKPSAVGASAIRSAYKAVFKAIDLDITFDIIEIAVVADDWAFARTNSNGITTINATGDKIAEGNQELFVLNKRGNEWKIARYSFSTTQPR